MPDPTAIPQPPAYSIRTLEEYQTHFGTEFYLFLHSSAGQALIQVLERNSPAKLLASVAPEAVTENGTAYAANIQGWEACVETIRTKLLVTGEPNDDLPPADYSGDGNERGEQEHRDQSPPEQPAPRRRRGKGK